MSTENGKDWITEMSDEMERFVAEVFPLDQAANELLLCDLGQAHLVADSLKPLFGSLDMKGGEGMTAKGFGKLLGHYEMLFDMMALSTGLLSEMESKHADLIDLRERIDVHLNKHAPNAIQGPQTGVIHLLAEFINPEHCRAAKQASNRFREKIQRVMEVAHSQKTEEREAFLDGYMESKSYRPFGADGLPLGTDKLASLLAVLRPFALAQEMTYADFQEVVDGCAKAQITGHPERFAKHLQRRHAPLRGKGRPAIKSATVSKAKRGKSDKI